MSYYVIWMDSKEAKIHEFLPGKVQTTKIEVSSTEAKNLVERDHHKMPTEYFHKLVERVKNATEILVVGPGPMKSHFLHHLENHKHQDIRKKVVGVESMDHHATEKQIIAEARRFFRAHDLFESLNT